MIAPEDVLDFWFSDATRPKWFNGGAAFDDEIKARFGGVHRRVVAGELDGWRGSVRGALALVIVLDQFSRNMFRGAPEAFASDGQALTTAKAAIAAGFDAALDDDGRMFLYMPFMHAESLGEQERGMALFAALGRAEQVDYMRRHRDIIARFGRFPHRNAILGRSSTEEEQAFLQQPGSGF